MWSRRLTRPGSRGRDCKAHQLIVARVMRLLVGSEVRRSPHLDDVAVLRDAVVEKRASIVV